MEKRFGDLLVRASGAAGLGVYALASFSAAQVIRSRTILREITDTEPLSNEERGDHVCVVDDRFYLVGEPDCYLNHSCDPNAYLDYQDNDIVLVARRKIVAGEQLTLDYLVNNSGGDSWKCECGAARCRGLTGHSFFDLPRDIQIEYLPLLAPWFRRKHQARIDLMRA